MTSLPFSDAFFCQVFPRECTATFQAGHCRALQFLGGVLTTKRVVSILNSIPAADTGKLRQRMTVASNARKKIPKHYLPWRTVPMTFRAMCARIRSRFGDELLSTMEAAGIEPEFDLPQPIAVQRFAEMRFLPVSKYVAVWRPK